MKTKNKMSFLERLPVELLDTVFLYCLNLELPRSSPILAGKLSSQNIYLRLTLIAFGPTWDQQDLSSKELANPVLQVLKIYMGYKGKANLTVCCTEMSLGYSRTNFEGKGFLVTKTHSNI